MQLLKVIGLLLLASSANAGLLFQDDFEGDLSQWTGKGGGAHDGEIVIDPLNAANKVLTFGTTEAAGEIFTVDSFDPASDTFVLSFRYLGTCQNNDCGGYMGYSNAFPGAHSWHYATGTVSGAADVLIDDGTWHDYEFTLASAGDLHIMLEDFVGATAPSVGRDAFWDDIKLSDGVAAVPEPATFGLIGFGLLALGLARRRR